MHVAGGETVMGKTRRPRHASPKTTGIPQDPTGHPVICQPQPPACSQLPRSQSQFPLCNTRPTDQFPVQQDNLSGPTHSRECLDLIKL